MVRRDFGGTSGTRWRYDAVDLPGINFNFSYNPHAGGVPTAAACSTTSASR